jgi:hypothetical protein
MSSACAFQNNFCNDILTIFQSIIFISYEQSFAVASVSTYYLKANLCRCPALRASTLRRALACLLHRDGHNARLCLLLQDSGPRDSPFLQRYADSIHSAAPTQHVKLKFSPWLFVLSQRSQRCLKLRRYCGSLY